jgi:hypothetical protein
MQMSKQFSPRHHGQVSIMKAKEIKKATNGLNFDQINYFLNNSGLELNLIQNLGFCKMWEVSNHSEICFISNTIKQINSNLAEVKFVFND